MIGVAQYDNKALLTHALFGEKTWISTAIMPLHTLRDMSFTYAMQVVFDEAVITGRKEPAQQKPDFYLRADDKKRKTEIQSAINAGEKFHIAWPIHVKKEDGLYLPICTE
jgi:hypothetical protein